MIKRNLIGLTFLSVMPTQAAVTSLPAAPTGYMWQLVSSGNMDNASASTTAAVTAIETDLGLNGTNAALPINATGSASETIALMAFGSSNPTSYSPGDTVDLVTSNTYSTSYRVQLASGVQNAALDPLFVENKLNSVEITSAVGGAGPADDLQTAFSTDPFVIPAVADSGTLSSTGALSQTEGEAVDFTYTAVSQLEVSAPFGGVGTPSYFASPTVVISLDRATEYDTYILVPEPSVLGLLSIALLGAVRRRR